MKLNPHGDAAIYETMVRLARGNETLLHPFVDSKGNFGKVYSRDMAYAASRYTEAKLEPICQELFRDIDADTVDFVDNYDGSMQEPVLLPTTFPNVLVSANMGIAVGMASNICSFNLAEVCRTTIALIKNPDCGPARHAPGARISRRAARSSTIRRRCCKIYQTGRGSFRLRAKWRYVKEGNMIEIYEIPYTTATEIILDKVAELIKANKVREISDMRDETDLNGLKLTIDLKRGADPDKLMQKLFKHDAAAGRLRLQLQHPHRRHAARDGRARDPAGVDRVADRVRAPQALFPDEQKEGQAAPAQGPRPDPSRYRQGHRHHPRDGA